MRRLSLGLALLALQIPSCAPQPEHGQEVDYDHDHGHASPAASPPDAPLVARVSAPARKNLGLVVQPLAAGIFRRAIEVPAVVVDRPGVSDRGVIAPVTGVVTKILAYPGDTVAPEQPLFAMRLVSERMHASQLELFKATKEIEIARRQRQRLTGLSDSGVVAQSRIIEIDNRLELLEVNLQAYRQDLLARGLSPERVAAAARGEFITEITVAAPRDEGPGAATHFEVQALRVALGQQVEAGAVLCELADHRRLLIEGHAFKSDLPALQEALKTNAAIEPEFDEGAGERWPAPPGPLRIEHLANAADPETRVIRFTIRLENQWLDLPEPGQGEVLWRFRPGDRLRLKIPAAERTGVFVVPREGIVREGGEAYVFRQNGDLFERRAVQILEESRDLAAIADDGSLRRGTYVACNGAAALNRIAKAQAASGQPANVHVHADGTVHAAH